MWFRVTVSHHTIGILISLGIQEYGGKNELIIFKIFHFPENISWMIWNLICINTDILLLVVGFPCLAPEFFSLWNISLCWLWAVRYYSFFRCLLHYSQSMQIESNYFSNCRLETLELNHLGCSEAVESTQRFWRFCFSYCLMKYLYDIIILDDWVICCSCIWKNLH